MRSEIQDNMHFVLFDLEATCWPAYTPGVSQEIIEIGALRMDRLGRVDDEFQSLVKPTIHPFLSPYCRNLTGIDQRDIDRARNFPSVWLDFEDWLVEMSDYFLISWGAVDERLIVNDLHYHKLDSSLVEGRFYDLKRIYKEVFRLPEKTGLAAAMRREGLESWGEAHRALDDARNLARIFHRHIDIWPIP